MDDREVTTYFQSPVNDGGVWNLYYNVAQKYGVVPQEVMPEARHEKPCGKSGGPPPKAKYHLVTDSAEYCEGKVKRTPGGE